MEFIDVINTRKSIRKYSDKAIEDEKLEQILECARWAPSWGNKQCWSFIVIRDQEKIKTISKSALINRWLINVPSLIVTCADPNQSGNRNGMDYFLVDVSIAMEHLVLAATNLGLGTCWIGAFDEKKIKNILNLPDYIRVVALTPIGYPAEKPNFREKITRKVVKSSKRKPLTEIIHYDEW